MMPAHSGLHSISGWFKLGLGWLVNACFSHSIYEGTILAILFSILDRKRVDTQYVRSSLCKQIGWDCGNDHVALCTFTSWASI
jgi:hypothetical protein